MVFALQNIAVITVTFLAWQVTGSLAVILLVAMVAGMIMSIFVSIPEVMKDQRKIRVLEAKLAEKEKEIEHYKELASGLTKY